MTQTDSHLFAEDQKAHDKLIKQLEKTQRSKARRGVNTSIPGAERVVRHDLAYVKPTLFVQQLRLYFVKFKRGLEGLNKSRGRMNEDLRAHSAFTSEVGQSFEALFLMEAESPLQCETFTSALGRQHGDLQRLTQWNNEHVSLREESFADSLNDYIICVTEFLRFVKRYEEEHLQPFDEWREAYISSKLQSLHRSLDGGQVSKQQVRQQLSEALARDDDYMIASKNFYLDFDQFLTECELFFGNRSLEMKIILRSFVACWRLYSQAVVGCLQENMGVIGQMDDRLVLSALVSRAKDPEAWRPPNGESIDVDRLSMTMMDFESQRAFGFSVASDLAPLSPSSLSAAFSSPNAFGAPGDDFSGSTNPLEAGRLFNEITGLRAQLGYGKPSSSDRLNEGGQDKEDENDDGLSVGGDRDGEDGPNQALENGSS